MADTLELVALVAADCNGLTSKLENVLVIIQGHHLNSTAQKAFFCS